MFRTSFLRASASTRQAVRQYSVATAKAGEQGNTFLAERQAQKEHAGGSADLWRKISYYLALPAVVVGYVNVKNMIAEHEAHLEHEKEEAGGELPERIVYPYMNKRDKEFPWGQEIHAFAFISQTALFFNPHANIASAGGEDEE